MDSHSILKRGGIKADFWVSELGLLKCKYWADSYSILKRGGIKVDPLAWIRTSTRRRRRGIHEKEKVDGDDVAFCILHFSVTDTLCLSPSEGQ